MGWYNHYCVKIILTDGKNITTELKDVEKELEKYNLIEEKINIIGNWGYLYICIKRGDLDCVYSFCEIIQNNMREDLQYKIKVVIVPDEYNEYFMKKPYLNRYEYDSQTKKIIVSEDLSKLNWKSPYGVGIYHPDMFY